MSIYSTEYHAMISSPSPAAQVAAPASGAAANPDPTKPDEGFFHHLLDVVNPLQHLPVIATIYRAITGEHIGAVERIAGDTLYGGLWGAVSSVADVAFEGITGKSVEDTVLSWFKSDTGSRVASIAAPQISAARSLPSSDTPPLPPFSPAVTASATGGSPRADTPGILAFSSALSAKGITGDMAVRALDAYRRAMTMPAQAPVFASVN
ncbi:MAG TPA: hypothetical protein VGG66_08615 [Rhizomicrobium sp.]|jgi:hypothetical protein